MKLSDEYATVRRRKYMRKYMHDYYANNPDKRKAQQGYVKRHRAKPENRRKHIEYMRNYHAKKKRDRLSKIKITRTKTT